MQSSDGKLVSEEDINDRDYNEETRIRNSEIEEYDSTKPRSLTLFAANYPNNSLTKENRFLQDQQEKPKKRLQAFHSDFLSLFDLKDKHAKGAFGPFTIFKEAIRTTLKNNLEKKKTLALPSFVEKKQDSPRMVIIGDPFRRVSVGGGNYTSSILLRHNQDRHKSDMMVHSHSASQNLLDVPIEDLSLTGVRAEPDDISAEDVDVTFDIEKDSRLLSCHKLLGSENVHPRFMNSKSAEKVRAQNYEMPGAFQESSFQQDLREVSSNEEFFENEEEEEMKEAIREDQNISVLSKRVELSDKDLQNLHLLQMKLLKLTDIVTQKCSEYIDKYEEQKQKLEEAESDQENERAQLRHNIGKAFPRCSHRKSQVRRDLPAKARFVHIGHQEFDLVIYILFGVKRAVDSLPELPLYQIRDNDYHIKCSYNLVTWLESDNEHKTCVFYDYAPQVFNEVRKVFNIQKQQYAEALNPAQIFGNFIGARFESLSQQMSSGKSGSFFYYSANGQYLVKTISNTEFKFFRSILKWYYLHVKDNPNTLISRIYGLYKIRFNKKQRNKRFDIPFVIMNNLFCTTKKIDIRYDLKGSTAGRRTVFKGEPDYSVALKDLNFRDKEEVINIGPQYAQVLKLQLERDAQFFAKLKIMDYSMLVGIHNIRQFESEVVSENNLENMCLMRESNKLRVSLNKRLPGYFKSEDGKRQFIVGIIDIFTEYNLTKKMEYLFKKIKSGRKISCIPPKAYAKRFVQFMHSIIN